MEQFLYKNYLKYLKENKTPLYKSLLALPRCAAMLLILLILSSALVLVFITMGNLRQYAFIPLGLEAVWCVASYFYSERYEINNSETYMTNYMDYCSDVYGWLKSLSVSVEKDSVIEIKRRIDVRLEKIEKAKEIHRNTIERIVQVIIIPVILAVFAAIIKNESDTNVIVVYGTVVIFFPIALILALFGVFELLNIIKKNEFEQLKSFSDVLQGILDTQYEDGIFEKINC